jgi:hypothetical protein
MKRLWIIVGAVAVPSLALAAPVGQAVMSLCEGCPCC